MSAIDEFLTIYEREFDYHHQAAQIVKARCMDALERAGIKAIVSFRAKSPDRLRLKLEQREKAVGDAVKYETITDIRNDIKDLSGVRIAVYFPGELDRIARIIDDEFVINAEPKTFPNRSDRESLGYEKIFSGYSASHYLVSVPLDGLSESQRKYSKCNVEIQVASVLMHAWAEVEHDLIYKPLSGVPSDDERMILDQINGLVLAGELALKQLQKAYRSRVSTQQFRNSYELAAFISEKNEPNENLILYVAPMGRIDNLLHFLQVIRMDGPTQLNTFATNVSNNAMNIGIAEEIAESIIRQHPEYNREYNNWFPKLQAENVSGELINDEDVSEYKSPQVDRFMSIWRSVEFELGRITSLRSGLSRRSMSVVHNLCSMGLISHDEVLSIQRGRKFRNSVVHRQGLVNDKAARELAEELRHVVTRLQFISSLSMPVPLPMGDSEDPVIP